MLLFKLKTLLNSVENTASFQQISVGTTTTILRPLYSTTCVSQHPSYELEDSVGAKLYCPDALADDN